MYTYADLLIKLKNASGPDRELGNLVLQALVNVYDIDANKWYGTTRCVTSSLEMARALADRELPGWLWRLGFNGNNICYQTHGSILHGEYAEGTSSTEPLAILIAVIEAKQSATERLQN